MNLTLARTRIENIRARALASRVFISFAVCVLFFLGCRLLGIMWKFTRAAYLISSFHLHLLQFFQIACSKCCSFFSSFAHSKITHSNQASELAGWRERVRERAGEEVPVRCVLPHIFGTFIGVPLKNPKQPARTKVQRNSAAKKHRLMFKLGKCNYIITVYLSKCGPHFVWTRTHAATATALKSLRVLVLIFFVPFLPSSFCSLVFSLRFHLGVTILCSNVEKSLTDTN